MCKPILTRVLVYKHINYTTTSHRRGQKVTRRNLKQTDYN